VNLIQALTLAAKSTDTRNRVPILGCILVDAHGVSATEMETHISVRVAVPGWEGPARPMNAKALIAAVKAAGADLAAIGPHAVTLTSGATIAVETMESEDFPSYAAGDLPTTFDIPAAALARMLARTAHAESKEATRYYLNGTYLHAHNGELRAVATDGHRMVVTDAPLPDGAAGMPGVIVPTAATKLLRAILGKKPEGTATVRLSDTRVQVAFGLVTLTSKLIDGVFPGYLRVVPQSPPPRMTVAAADFRAAIKAATAGADKGATVTIKDGEVRCMASRVPLPEAASVPEVGFHGQYLLDMLDHAGATVAMAQTDPADPAVFTDPADASWFEVIMPKRF
jgi:DNA polymerase-3 subunit beta